MRRAPFVRSLLCMAPFCLLDVAADAQPTPANGSGAAPLTSTPEGPSSPRLGPEHALALALEANPSFRATLLDAISARASARAAGGTRAPTFVSTTTGAYNERMTGTAAGVTRTRDRSVSNSIGLRYTSDVGTVLSLDIANTTQWREINRDNSTAALSLIGPTHATSATLTARQPLLRGAGRVSVLSDTREADARVLEAESDTADAASSLVVDVLGAYWELWYAERALFVQTEAVALATRQLADARQKQRLGTLASADVLRFATEEAELRETLTTATATRTSRALELARLLGMSAAEAARLVTRDDAPEAPALPDMASLGAALRSSSPALMALAAGVDAARVRHDAAMNAARARLDLTGTLGAAALWAPNDVYTGLQFPAGRPAFVGTVGLELELPLVSSVADARRASAEADLEAAESRYDAEVARLEASLASEHASLAGAIARIELTAETARVASELAVAERGRVDLGTSTPTVLVQAQQTARASQLRHARAIVDSTLSSARFAHAAGVLLERFDLAVPEGVTP